MMRWACPLPRRVVAFLGATPFMLVACVSSASDAGVERSGLTAVREAVVLVSVEGVGASGTFQGVGSGFVYDRSGLVLTAQHVVAGATVIRVEAETGDRWPHGWWGGAHATTLLSSPS